MARGVGWQRAREAGILLDEARLTGFCARWHVSSLELFGSVLRHDFRPDSDVDVLISFEPHANWGLIDHATMEEELAAMLGRPVDLLTRRAVERSANRLRRSSILADAIPLVTRECSNMVDAHVDG